MAPCHLATTVWVIADNRLFWRGGRYLLYCRSSSCQLFFLGLACSSRYESQRSRSVDSCRRALHAAAGSMPFDISLTCSGRLCGRRPSLFQGTCRAGRGRSAVASANFANRVRMSYRPPLSRTEQGQGSKCRRRTHGRPTGGASFSSLFCVNANLLPSLSFMATPSSLGCATPVQPAISIIVHQGVAPSTIRIPLIAGKVNGENGNQSEA